MLDLERVVIDLTGKKAIHLATENGKVNLPLIQINFEDFNEDEKTIINACVSIIKEKSQSKKDKK